MVLSTEEAATQMPLEQRFRNELGAGRPTGLEMRGTVSFFDRVVVADIAPLGTDREGQHGGGAGSMESHARCEASMGQ